MTNYDTPPYIIRDNKRYYKDDNGLYSLQSPLEDLAIDKRGGEPLSDMSLLGMVEETRERFGTLLVDILSRFHRYNLRYEDTMDAVLYITNVLIILGDMKELCEKYLDQATQASRELDRMLKKFNEEDRDGTT